MTTDAETIANLRQSLAERDAEIRWLRSELRHADALLLAKTKAEPWKGAHRCPAGGGLIRKAE